jgi:VCBS repeat-containing protein
VVLLAVAGVIVFLRFHHAPFAVTSAVITQQTRNGCSVDVTGKIATSGGAGTVSYQWVFRPDSRPPQPLTQTVIAGQKAVFVTVAVEGGATQSVTLQVLGPDQESATTAVASGC